MNYAKDTAKRGNGQKFLQKLMMNVKGERSAESVHTMHVWVRAMHVCKIPETVQHFIYWQGQRICDALFFLSFWVS